MASARDLKHVGKSAKKVKARADQSKVVPFDRKPLRPGQRHKGARVRKPRIVTTYTEAPEVEERANVMIGQDAFRFRSLAQAKILFLYTSAERLTGCLEGLVRASRYPRMFRYKSQLKYEFLVLVAKPRWERATDEEKTRIAYHALRHFGSDTAGRWRTEGHDIEGFVTEVEQFGLRDARWAKLDAQMQLFKGKD